MLGKEVTVRSEARKDWEPIRQVNDLAFGQADEGAIVNKIRANCDECLSLVAEIHGRVVGHIFFSPATIERGSSLLRGMALAPMAVLPEFQRQGVGARLVRTGVETLRKRGCPFVVVLGHPEYYPKFGFARASLHGLSCQWDGIPDEAFMVMILGDKASTDVSGVARYREEFDPGS